jgi:hypothetical protein
LRRAVFEACGQRAEHASNLWLVYSARHERDWVLTGDAEFLHFHCLDFAPEVESFDLKPQPRIIRLRDEDRKTEFDAIVRFRDGHTECREIKRQAGPPTETEERVRWELQAEAQELAAKQEGGRYVRLSMVDLEPFAIRIQNSLRMTRFILAARNEALGELRKKIEVTLQSHGSSMQLDALVKSVSAHPGLAYAAIFQLVVQGVAVLPIDTDFVTAATLVDVRK